jgi:DNA-binding PadR family transcriptional regulator
VTNTLGFALLGLLVRGPLSGYDIAARLKHGAGPFWHARHSQIYPELARLEADGLLSHERVEQLDRPDKKVYSVTPLGRERLVEWVTSALSPDQIRDELTLRAYSVWVADRVHAAALFREQAERHREQLAEYEGYQQQMEGVYATQLAQPSSPEFATYATLRRGIGYEREQAEWCAWLAQTLEQPD